MSRKLPDNRTLPNREAVVFRSIVRYYEQKQYKRALKAADQVLKRFPQHGETLAMRGLTLNALDKKEEAYDHVKRGLRNDLKSHVCWHVYGLLYRSDRNYGEAIKCYLNALKWDSENLQILRDLSLLQVQLQDYDGFIETRRKILTLKSNNKMHWISYAVANLLGGRCDTAVRVIDSYLATETESSADASSRFEDSELVLFRNQAVCEGGNFEDALRHLEEVQHKVVDTRSYHAQKAELLLRLGRHQEAASVFHVLLDANCENYEYHRGFQAALLQLDAEKLAVVLETMKSTALPSSEMMLDDPQRDALAQAYDGLLEKFPRSAAVRRIPLQILKEEDAQPRLRDYVAQGLRKGKPNLGADLRTLLRMPDPARPGYFSIAKDPFDVRTLTLFDFLLQVADESIASLKQDDALPDGEGEANPSVLLFAMYLKVQLLEAANRLEEALALAEECIEHTPTAIDFYLRKGRLLKKMGQFDAAAEVIDFARRIDLADRYVNNKATKYLLRADRVEQAESTIALFTRHEGDPQFNLYEMQCSWYELEWAESQLRQRKYGLALKKFFAVDKHFEDFMEDQFDFHTYCVRKGTLRAYVDLLRMASGSQSHAMFQRAARGIITTYLRLHDDPSSVVAVQTNGTLGHDENVPNGAQQTPSEPTEAAPQMTAAQRKKAKQKAKKAAKKNKEKKEKATKEENEEDKEEGKAETGRRKSKPADDDPYGEKLLSRSPLSEASKFCSILNLRAPHVIDTHILSYDVSARRGKSLMSLRALVKGFEVAPRDPELFKRIVDFEDGIASGRTPLDETQAGIVTSMASRWRREGVADFVHEYADFACGDLGNLAMRTAAAAATAKLDSSKAAEALGMVRGGLRGRGVSVASCRAALQAVKAFAGDEAAELEIEIRELFPSAGF